MIVIIDNYDSFTYNLVQLVGEIGGTIQALRNDQVTVDEILTMNPSHIIISPGPGTPEDGGISCELIQKACGKIPILGVCLGHQCIAHAFSAKVVRAGRLMHGKTSMITHDGKHIFRDVPDPFEATRYHSLIVSEKSLPRDFTITARTVDKNELMGIRHKKYPLEGVQFHPESFLTESGKPLMRNFLGI